MLALVAVLLLNFMPARKEGYRNATNISFFGGKGDDNGIGYSGIDLYSYQKKKVMFNGRRVYPVSVPPRMWDKLGYMVLKVEAPGMKTIYGHVMDICDSGDCAQNIARNSFNMIVDIHQTAWKAAGKNDGLLKGGYTVVGRIRPWQLTKDMWMKGVQRGTDSLRCNVNNKTVWVEWKDVKKCK